MNLRSSWLAPLSLAFALSAATGCNVEQTCRDHYSTPQEIGACTDGARAGSVLTGQVAAMDNDHRMAISLQIRTVCTTQANFSYPTRSSAPNLRNAFIDACVAMFRYASPVNPR